PQRPLRGDVDDVGVARVDQDLADVLGGSQPHALPRLAGVGGFVDAGAQSRAALAGVFTGAEPDHAGVLRIDDDAAEREGAAVVEDRREGRPAVAGFPQAAEGRRDVPDVRILRVDGDVLHAARGNRGTDAAELEALDDLGRQAVPRRGRRLARARRDGAGKAQRDNRGYEQTRWLHSMHLCRDYLNDVESNPPPSAGDHDTPGILLGFGQRGQLIAKPAEAFFSGVVPRSADRRGCAYLVRASRRARGGACDAARRG